MNDELKRARILSRKIEALIAAEATGSDEDRFADTMTALISVAARRVADPDASGNLAVDPVHDLRGARMFYEGMVALLTPNVRADLMADSE